MEAVMLVEGEYLAFEPLSSYISINELKIGDNSIFYETLGNLWRSGVSVVHLVVERSKVPIFKSFAKSYHFGKRGGHINVEIVSIDAKRIEAGPALREFFVTRGTREDFILLYWNTLLTTSLSEAIELHHERKDKFPKYSMSVLYVKDTDDRRFSGIRDDAVFLYDTHNELVLHVTGQERIRLTSEHIKSLSKHSEIKMRYDLFNCDVYICTRKVVGHFELWFDQREMEEYITESLSQEIGADGIYVTLLENDVFYPSFPAAIRIATPRIYYNVYMEYIQRFMGSKSVNKPIPGGKETNMSIFGPRIREGSIFLNGSGISLYQSDPKNLFEATYRSIVGQNVSIDSNSFLEGCIIFDNVKICKNCSIKDSIIMNDVTVLDGSQVPRGSIVGAFCTIQQDFLANSVKSFKCSNTPTKYIDITREISENIFAAISESNGHKTHLWDLEGFIEDFKLHIINESFYDRVRLILPSESVCSEPSNVQDDFEDYPASPADYSPGGGDLFPGGAVPSEQIAGAINEEIEAEIEAMVTECLGRPDHLEGKILEIRSLKISQNLQESAIVLMSFRKGLAWIVSQCHKHDEEEFRENVEHLICKGQFRQLLDSFNCNFENGELFQEVYSICKGLKKDLDYFCRLCECLYHTDVIDFDGFKNWLELNSLSAPRLDSFANWLESD